MQYYFVDWLGKFNRVVVPRGACDTSASDTFCNLPKTDPPSRYFQRLLGEPPHDPADYKIACHLRSARAFPAFDVSCSLELSCY